jgi:hypothetical protein
VTGALSLGTYLLGAVQLGFTIGCALTAATLLVRRTELTELPRFVATALLTAFGVILAELLPLLFGVLTRGTVLLAAALVLLITWLVTRRLDQGQRVEVLDAEGATVGTHATHGSDGAGRPEEGPNLSRLLGVIAVVATGAAWLAAVEVLASQHVSSVDALSFHFPGVIRYIQTGTLWQQAQYIPDQAQANYPQYGDLLLLAATLPWHSLALVRYVDPLMLTLAALAAYGAARELGSPRPTAAIVVLALFALRPTLTAAIPDDLTDPTFLAGYATGILFLLRYRRTAATADLLLAAVGFGLALGTKWYGLEDVPLLVLAWAVIVRPGWRPFLTMVVAVAVFGGVWLIRNWVLTGDPIFDERVRLFGVTIFAAPYSSVQHEIGFSLAHYLTHFHILKAYVWPVFRSDFGVTGLIVAVAALAGVAVSRRDQHRWMLLAGGVLCVIAYLITPYTALGFAGKPVLVDANTRYGIPALILGAPLAAVAIARLGRWRVIVELGLLISMFVDLHRYLPSIGGSRLVLNAILVVIVLVALLLRVLQARGRALLVERFGIQLGRIGPARAIGLLPLILVVCLALAYHWQRTLSTTPYEPNDPTVDYVLAHYPAHTRIGVTGIWNTGGTELPAPLFGPRFENTVSYVGPFIDHRLAEYTQEGPFVAALRRDRDTLLEVGNGTLAVADPLEVRWAEAAGYAVVAASQRLTLLRAPARSA